MANTTVTVGPKAQVFHDQSTGITICRGEKVSLRPNQFNSRRIQTALSQGHLILVQEEATVEKYSDADIEKLDKKIKAQFNKGTTIEKIATSINLEQATLLAAKNDVTAEAEDTVETILKAILEEDE